MEEYVIFLVGSVVGIFVFTMGCAAHWGTFKWFVKWCVGSTKESFWFKSRTKSQNDEEKEGLKEISDYCLARIRLIKRLEDLQNKGLI